MKLLKTSLLGLLFLISPSQATSLHPDTYIEGKVAQRMVRVPIDQVSAQGRILREVNQRPYTTFVIGIDVLGKLPNACTTFVGQHTHALGQNRGQRIELWGTASPLNDICMAVLPPAVETMVTFKWKILTGGFAPAQRYQEELVNLVPMGIYRVVLDMETQEVEVSQVVESQIRPLHNS